MDTNEEALLYAEFEKALESKNYQIDGRLGKGAYGQVFKAKCRGDNKTYAIKILPANNDKDQKPKRAINDRYQERELEALIRLNQLEESKRNFIEYFASWFLEFGNEQSIKRVLCIQMELCWGDLKLFIFKKRHFGPQFKGAQFYQHVFKQILNGLIVIHSIGWVHRDIHPGNILVVNSNPQQISDIHVKIGDFGVAKYKEITLTVSAGFSVHAQEQYTPACGKKSIYAAPELFTETYNEKVDLYSVGAVLYFISRYPKKNEEQQCMTELDNHDRTGKGLVHIDKDDKILFNLIRDLRRTSPDERPSASEAKKNMFPQMQDSTDGKKAQKIKFFARRKNDEDLRMCSLSRPTISALKAEVERRTRVKANELRQEDMINDKDRRVIIEDDEDVEMIFENAAEKAKEDRYVVVVVTEEAEEHNSETTPLSSGDIMMQSASPIETI